MSHTTRFKIAVASSTTALLTNWDRAVATGKERQ